VTRDQCRQARWLLRWSRVRLEAASGVPAHVVTRFESSGYISSARDGSSRDDAVPCLRAALEAAGVEFTNGDAPGVRLRK
jgi:hypothetical protein